MPTIIDADGHIVEPREIWEEYTESAYRDGVIQIARDSEGIDCLRINGEIRRDRNMTIAAACTPGGLSEPNKARTMGWNKSDASSPSIRALSTSANDALSPEAYRNTRSMSALGWN